jgi:putative exosortase-associated protein (TIGR04073 family)
MTAFNRFFYVLCAGLLIAHVSAAQADMQQDYGYPAGGAGNYAPVPGAANQSRPTSYGEKIGSKAVYAFANLGMGWLEIPKNIINTINKSNFFYGTAGGTVKGLVNTLGRMGSGIADIITLPIPTKPVAYPLFVSDDFDVDTTYAPLFRLNTHSKAEQPAVAALISQAAPDVAATPPAAAAVDRSRQYNQDTNRKLDRIFKNEMRK